MTDHPSLETAEQLDAADSLGGHVSLWHGNAQPISLALGARGVVPDFRKPDVIRSAPSPLYNPFGECWGAIQILKEIVATRLYEEFETTSTLVT